MPAGFEWGVVDVNNPDEMRELYTLLSENYVEDDDCQFRYINSLFPICTYHLQFRFNIIVQV